MTNRFANRSFGGSGSGESSQGSTGKVDWAAYNKHIVDSTKEAFGFKGNKSKSVVGFISGIVDLGLRVHDEVVEEYVQSGKNSEDANARRARLVDKGKAELFTEEVDGVEVEMIKYTPVTTREVCYYIDFPQCTVDKGQFFGDSNPAPYRVLWGGVYKRIPKSFPVSGYKSKKGEWLCSDKSIHTMFAEAADIDFDEGFPQADLVQLIGKPIMVSLSVCMNDAGYLEEKVLNPTKMPEGMPTPDYDEDLLFYVGFNDEENTDRDIQFLSPVVREYMSGASNYEGSVVKTQIEAVHGVPEDNEDKTGAKPVSKPESKPVQKKVTEPSEPEEEEDVIDDEDDEETPEFNF